MKNKTFLSINFGCRVNAAETNQFSQTLIESGFSPFPQGGLGPDLIFINTCAITKKGEYESLSKISQIQKQYPQAKIIATGCADLSKIKNLNNVEIISKDKLPTSYTHQINDKFSHTNRYLLKIQSGCTQNCSYCIVPLRRPHLWSLPIAEAVQIVNQAVADGYQEVINTGVNLAQYQYGFSNLLETLLTQTKIPLISFGSIPLLCVDDKFINLYYKFSSRLSPFLHIPIQSGSDKILRLMRRPYTKKQIVNIFHILEKISLVKGRSGEAERDLTFGTDIIIGFPIETDFDFQETFDLCQQIGFSKIHVFKFSPRPDTPARELFLSSLKISKSILISRSQKIRSLTSQTTLPSHQIPGRSVTLPAPGNGLLRPKCKPDQYLPASRC